MVHAFSSYLFILAEMRSAVLEDTKYAYVWCELLNTNHKCAIVHKGDLLQFFVVLNPVDSGVRKLVAA
jgi:hypothetical protein